MRRVLFLVAAVLAVICSGSAVRGGDVTYDGRSLIIDGQRKIVFSGSIHYPRSTPEVLQLTNPSMHAIIVFVLEEEQACQRADHCISMQCVVVLVENQNEEIMNIES